MTRPVIDVETGREEAVTFYRCDRCEVWSTQEHRHCVTCAVSCQQGGYIVGLCTPVLFRTRWQCHACFARDQTASHCRWCKRAYANITCTLCCETTSRVPWRVCPDDTCNREQPLCTDCAARLATEAVPASARDRCPFCRRRSPSVIEWYPTCGHESGHSRAPHALLPRALSAERYRALAIERVEAARIRDEEASREQRLAQQAAHADLFLPAFELQWGNSQGSVNWFPIPSGFESDTE